MAAKIEFIAGRSMTDKEIFEENVAELVRAVRDQIADDEWADLQEIVAAVMHRQELRRKREIYREDHLRVRSPSTSTKKGSKKGPTLREAVESYVKPRKGS